jgi:hypothetical protein
VLQYDDKPLLLGLAQGKIVFQSFFMLRTIQSLAIALSQALSNLPMGTFDLVICVFMSLIGFCLGQKNFSAPCGDRLTLKVISLAGVAE